MVWIQAKRRRLHVALRRQPILEPAAKEGDLLLRPLSVARHRALAQAREDVLRVRPHVVVIPEVEGEIHGRAVVLTKQRLDVSREAGCVVFWRHRHAPSLNIHTAVCKTVATSGSAPRHIRPFAGWSGPVRT